MTFTSKTTSTVTMIFLRFFLIIREPILRLLRSLRECFLLLFPKCKRKAE